jgi:hypothetical protein
MGTDGIANGQNSDHEKWPARRNCHVAMEATRTFSRSAVGRTTTTLYPSRVSTAI